MLLAAVVVLLLANGAALGRFLVDVAHWRDDPASARKVLADRHADDRHVTNAATVLGRAALDAIRDLREVAARGTPASEHAVIYLRQISEEAAK